MVPTANARVNWYFYWVEVLERSHTTICAAFTTRCVSLRGCRVEFEYEGQLAKAQHALPDFLWTELNVGPALVESAALAKSAGGLRLTALCDGEGSQCRRERATLHRPPQRITRPERRLPRSSPSWINSSPHFDAELVRRPDYYFSLRQNFFTPPLQILGEHNQPSGHPTAHPHPFADHLGRGPLSTLNNCPVGN